MSYKIINGIGIWFGLSLGTVAYTACTTKNWSQCWRTVFDYAVAVGTTVVLL